MGINKREYPFNPTRKGYNIPHACEWKLLEYRMKKEVIPEFVRDLGNVINLAPSKTPSLWDLFRKPKIDHKTASVGPAILYAQWMLKQLRKTPIGKKIQPVDPVTDRPINKFADGWAYNIVLGWIPDIERGQGEEL